MFALAVFCVPKPIRFGVLSKNSDDTRLSLRQQMDWPTAAVTEMMAR